MRIDTAEQQMLNPHWRVSEVTFAAGDQSLSQFNRTFRSIVDESPTTYWNRLAGLWPARARHRAVGPIA